MKIFKKFILPISIIGMLLLQINIIYANNKSTTNDIELKTHSTYHSSENGGDKITGTGFANKVYGVYCHTNKDNHNRAKVHYYNRTSEPVYLYIDNEPPVTVNPWSGNSITLRVKNGDALDIEIRGYDNSWQKLDGELYCKSWFESN